MSTSTCESEHVLSDLDPVIRERFAWTRGFLLEDILVDANLSARFQRSYDTDATYAPPTCAVEDHTVAVSHGGPLLPVRVYRPRAASPKALVWVHGGGFISGSYNGREADGVARELAARADLTVVTVDYTLANGSLVTYPLLHSEVEAAFEWAHRQSRQLGIDPDHIALGGASAGANLALAAARLRRDQGKPLPNALLLVYPLLHRSLPPFRHEVDLDVLPPVLRIRQSLVDTMFAAYLGEQSSIAAPYVEIDETQLAELPRALVVVSEYDDLRASGEATSDALRRAGVPTTHYLARETIHGHLSLSGNTSETARTLSAMRAFLANDNSRPRLRRIS